jgi:hypothetical protein
VWSYQLVYIDVSEGSGELPCAIIQPVVDQSNYIYVVYWVILFYFHVVESVDMQHDA